MLVGGTTVTFMSFMHPYLAPSAPILVLNLIQHMSLLLPRVRLDEVLHAPVSIQSHRIQNLDTIHNRCQFTIAIQDCTIPTGQFVARRQSPSGWRIIYWCSNMPPEAISFVMRLKVMDLNTLWVYQTCIVPHHGRFILQTESDTRFRLILCKREPRWWF